MGNLGKLSVKVLVIKDKFPLMLIGVLSPHLRTLYGVARLPIDTKGHFWSTMSAKSPSNTSLLFPKNRKVQGEGGVPKFVWVCGILLLFFSCRATL